VSDGLSDLASWLQANWLPVVVVAAGAFLLWTLARPLVHRAVRRAVTVPVVEGVDRSLLEAEAAKRAETIESLLAKLIKGGVVFAVVLSVMAVLGLLPVIGALGIVVAAITLAGQSIVLDYLMGMLILIEGPYFVGDYISVGTAEGTVEEVGLRRTVVRDTTGTVHSISNGEIRIASNLTRVYAALVVDVPVVPGTDVERAAAVMDRIGADLATDPAWADRILEAPSFRNVAALTDNGIILRAVGRVRAGDRWAVPGEYRRRLALGFQEAGIELPQRGRVVIGSMAPAVAPDEGAAGDV
jgi:small conductance mechanosensitive channel